MADENVKPDKLNAFKSLSSMIISLLSVVGIVFTIVVYYLVSPSLASLSDTSGHLLGSIITIAKATESNSEALYTYANAQSKTDDHLLQSINSTIVSLKSTREFIDELESTSGRDYSNYTLSLKDSEDQLRTLYIQISAYQSSKPKIQRLSDQVYEIQTYSSQIQLSVNALSTLFTGLTVILIIIFVSLIVLSTEDLLT